LLDHLCVRSLVLRGHFLNLSDTSIKDRSKADGLAKGLVCVQVLWMIIQCIGRKVSDLPLTLLEIHTLVHVEDLHRCWITYQFAACPDWRLHIVEVGRLYRPYIVSESVGILPCNPICVSRACNAASRVGQTLTVHFPSVIRVC
jgi:hypothetical protein